MTTADIVEAVGVRDWFAAEMYYNARWHPYRGTRDWREVWSYVREIECEHPGRPARVVHYVGAAVYQEARKHEAEKGKA